MICDKNTLKRILLGFVLIFGMEEYNCILIYNSFICIFLYWISHNTNMLCVDIYKKLNKNRYVFSSKLLRKRSKRNHAIFFFPSYFAKLWKGSFLKASRKEEITQIVIMLRQHECMIANLSPLVRCSILIRCVYNQLHH